MSAAAGSTPFWGVCHACGHLWIVAYAPAPLARFARIIANAVCPKCGAGAFVAKQRDGILLPQHPVPHASGTLP